MAKTKLLLEFTKSTKAAFEMHQNAVESTVETESVTRSLMDRVSGLGVELDENATPIPFFTKPGETHPADLESFGAFSAASENPDMKASTLVVPVEVDQSQVEKLHKKRDVTVWPNSPLTLLSDLPVDLASARGGVDCRPFRDGVEIETVRNLLGVRAAWDDGHLGDTVVGIIDEGVNGDEYPVIGGFSRPNAARQPGAAPITSHGSMCAADVLVAAPAARILDYPFLGIQNSGGAIQMFQAVLDQRRLNGTPHLTNNSYGFVGIPPIGDFPNHEVHDINHPVHRKVREVIASGAACFFAAGNCGENCPSGACHFSGIGPGRSIHASNSLEEVITVAAVNSRWERVGYSSQGPGMFEETKPDFAAYTHFFGNFGPDRPGGLDQPFDNGTSAATPVAAGVGALLLSAFPATPPDLLKQVLMETTIDIGTSAGWDPNHGHGVLNAAAAYNRLKSGAALTS